jgi:hypothetical protein
MEVARVQPVNDNVSLVFANVMDFFSPVVADPLPHFLDYYAVIDNPSAKVKKADRLPNTCSNTGNDSGIECGPDRVP